MDASHTPKYKMAASSSLYKISMQTILADSNLMQEMKMQVHYPGFMHHDSEKIQATHSAVTVLGLLKKKERRWWMKCVGGNVISMKLKAAVSVDTTVQHV